MELIVVEADPENVEAVDSPSKSGAFDATRLSFKSLFGKRALWRRIFFASKKVRGIILLNAITIIYGKLLNLRFFLVAPIFSFYCSFYFILLFYC